MNLFKRDKDLVPSDGDKGIIGETPFNIILGSEILTDKDLAILEPLKDELKETFIKVQGFRTRTEMEISVLNDVKHPTPESKYWQSVREQSVMFENLVFLSYDYRKNLIKIKIIQKDIDKEEDELQKELKQIELEKKMFILKTQEKTAKERIREIKAWSEIKEREAKSMSKESLKDVDNHQLITYTKRWIKQNIIMADSGSPSERHNLLGQLRSGILACIDKGILDKVLEDFDDKISNQIKSEYKFRLK